MTTELLHAGLFKSAIEAMGDCVLVLDLEGRIRYLNRPGFELLKLKDFALIEGVRWADYSDAEYKDQATDAIAAALRGERSHFEARRATNTGEDIWWDVRCAPLEHDAATVAAIIVVARDITPARLALAEAAGAAAALRSAQEIAHLGGWSYDRATDVVCFTAELGSMIKAQGLVLPLDEAQQTWRPEDREPFREALARACADGAAFTFEGLALDGRQWMRVTGEPTFEDGQCVGVRGASQDVTAQRELTDRLKASEQSARQAADAMSAFLATMSHEIRTPLNGVLGMAQAMAMGELPAVQRERLEVIQGSGEALLSLLNDLLDLSKIQAGKIELEDGQVDPEALADSVRAFDSLLQHQDVSLAVSVTPAARGLWRGDPTRVRQVLHNLVSNAVKFTERGRIDVTIDCRDGAFMMVVADTGVGIAEDKLARIFERFVQADATTTRRFGGSGLGLSICSELVGLMQGTIEVRSRRGEGATFTVLLPLERRPRSAAPDAPATHKAMPRSPAAALRVLAAEDNAMNQVVLKTLLGAVGIEPTFVADGREAVQAWRSGDWDVVLMDVQMPVMDGLEAVAEIRAAERREGQRHTPIVALTANAMAHHRRQYLSAGMDGVVAKPIELGVLLREMDAAIASVHARPADEPHEGAAPPPAREA